jgi:hypothetical protein
MKSESQSDFSSFSSTDDVSTENDDAPVNHVFKKYCSSLSFNSHEQNLFQEIFFIIDPLINYLQINKSTKALTLDSDQEQKLEDDFTIITLTRWRDIVLLEPSLHSIVDTMFRSKARLRSKTIVSLIIDELKDDVNYLTRLSLKLGDQRIPKFDSFRTASRNVALINNYTRQGFYTLNSLTIRNEIVIKYISTHSLQIIPKALANMLFDNSSDTATQDDLYGVIHQMIDQSELYGITQQCLKQSTTIQISHLTGHCSKQDTILTNSLADSPRSLIHLCARSPQSDTSHHNGTQVIMKDTYKVILKLNSNTKERLQHPNQPIKIQGHTFSHSTNPISEDNITIYLKPGCKVTRFEETSLCESGVYSQYPSLTLAESTIHWRQFLQNIQDIQTIYLPIATENNARNIIKTSRYITRKLNELSTET